MPRVDVDGNLAARIGLTGLNFFLSASSRRTHSFAHACKASTVRIIISYQIGGHEYVPPKVLGLLQTGLLPIVDLILHGAKHPFLL